MIDLRLAATIRPKLHSLNATVAEGIHRFHWVQAAAIFVVSGVVFGVGFRFSTGTFLRENLSVCWPLVGLQAAALLRVRRQHWPATLLGMALSQIVLERAEPLAEITADTLCDVCEVLIAAFCLPALNGLSAWMKQPRLFRRFLLWPTLLGPALTAFPIAAIFSRELHVSFWSYWARWFLGDALGIVLWLPLGIVLMSQETLSLFRVKASPRTFGLLGILSLTAWAIFQLKPMPIDFILLPLLLVIALKLGFSGSVLAVNLLGIISARGTLHHLGPFSLLPDPYSVTTLQVFLACSMLMCFPVAILLLERDSFEFDMQEAYARMEQLAICDGLTGLANRRRFDTVFDEEWRRALRDGDSIAILMIDVDSFKLFNDLYGHLAGDECLRQVANSLRGNVKRAGDLAARFGGEEFIVMMPRTDLPGALAAAETLRAGVQMLQLKHQRSSHLVVTISIGCWSTIPVADIMPSTLVDTADRGLYLAKQSGRNRIGTISAALSSHAGILPVDSSQPEDVLGSSTVHSSVPRTEPAADSATLLNA